MARYVVKLGGSVLCPDGPDPASIGRLAGELGGLAEGAELFVVVGGGKAARRYIEAARALGASDAECDALAIGLTRANARLLIAALGARAFPVPPRSVEEAASAAATGRVVVMGGTVPGHTTDAVAAVLAEYVRADALVLCKDVAGVFSADPKRDKRARLIPRLTGERLVELVSRAEAVAGVSAVTDLLAAKVIERSSMRAYVVDGREEGAVAAARGGPCRGSVVN